MNLYYQHAGITIYQGDCRELEPRALEFTCVLTDPPYGLNAKINRRRTTIPGDSDTLLRDWAVKTFATVPMIMFGSPRVDRPRGARMVLIWDKSELAGLGEMRLPWKLTHEEIYIFGERFDASFGRSGSVLRVPLRMPWTHHHQSVSGEHPTEKPVELMRRLARCLPAGTVLDPFSGSGSTLIAAKALGRTAIGIELEEKYCELAARRLSQEVLPFESHQTPALHPDGDDAGV
jgi:DNA modification methylase